MSFNLAHWTGIAVAAIVVSGSDTDVLYAAPLGLLAGAVATFCCSLSDNRAVLREQDGPGSKARERSPR